MDAQGHSEACYALVMHANVSQPAVTDGQQEGQFRVSVLKLASDCLHRSASYQSTCCRKVDVLSGHFFLVSRARR